LGLKFPTSLPNQTNQPTNQPAKPLTPTAAAVARHEGMGSSIPKSFLSLTCTIWYLLVDIFIRFVTQPVENYCRPKINVDASENK
jgi:hypothetical protein